MLLNKCELKKAVHRPISPIALQTKASSAKDQRIYYMRTKSFCAPWNYQMNLLVSLWFLFCCHLGQTCDLYFRQKYWKSFCSCDKNILFGYNIKRGIQQTTSISFFPFVGYQSGNQNKTHFALLGSRSEHRFAARSRVLPKHKIGPQCVHVWLTKLSCFLVSGVSLGFY